MVAARIVHARGARGSQQRGGRPSKGGARGGAPPQLPPPLPETRLEAAEKRGRRGGAVVAVDLLELETDLPGVEVSEGWAGNSWKRVLYVLLYVETLLRRGGASFGDALVALCCLATHLAIMMRSSHAGDEPCMLCT